MAEGNGTGTLDRIERALDRLEQVIEIDHDYLRKELRILMRGQVLTQRRMDKERAENKEPAENKERQTNIDERIDKLVAAIGTLIAQGKTL